MVGRGPLASAAWAPGLPARPHDQPLGLRKLRRDSAREIPQWTLYNGHAKQPPLSLGWRGMEGRGDRERAAAERILPPITGTRAGTRGPYLPRPPCPPPPCLLGTSTQAREKPASQAAGSVGGSGARVGLGDTGARTSCLLGGWTGTSPLPLAGGQRSAIWGRGSGGGCGHEGQGARGSTGGREGPQQPGGTSHWLLGAFPLGPVGFTLESRDPPQGRSPGAGGGRSWGSRATRLRKPVSAWGLWKC